MSKPRLINKDWLRLIIRVEVLLLVLVVLAWLLKTRTGLDLFPLKNNNFYGQLTLGLFLFTFVGGILRRFNILTSIASVHIFYRRAIGILTYILMLVHFISNYSLLQQFFVNPEFGSDIINSGLVSGVILTPVFLSSSDFAQKILKKNWKIAQRCTYFVLLTIGLHMYFQKSFVWLGLVSVMAVLIMGSIYLLKLRGVGISSGKTNKF